MINGEEERGGIQVDCQWEGEAMDPGRLIVKRGGEVPGVIDSGEDRDNR